MKKAYTNTIHKNAGPLAMNAGSKAKAKQRMPACSYGAACNRPGCVYRHPPKNAAAKSNTGTATTRDADPAFAANFCRPFLSNTCQFGNRCMNRHPPPGECDSIRKSFKGKKCMYNMECRNEGCLFFHDWENSDGVDHAEVERLAREMEAASLWRSTLPAAAAPMMMAAPTPPRETFEEWIQGGCVTPDQDIWFDTETGTQRIPEDVYALLHSLPPPPPPTKPPVGWAAIAATPAVATPPQLLQKAPLSARAPLPSIAIPSFVWNLNAYPANTFHLPPDERYKVVNSMHAKPLPVTKTAVTKTAGGVDSGAGVVDLHFQSLSTFESVLTQNLSSELQQYGEVWVITGSGHHVAVGHQVTGGVLFKEVKAYLEEWLGENKGCKVFVGKDGGGKSGAFLVVSASA
jgi:hypothetical protein